MSSGSPKSRLVEGFRDPRRTEPTNPAVVLAEGASQTIEGLKPQETSSPHIEGLRPMADSQFRGIPIQLESTAGRIRSEEARSDSASYGSLDGDRRSSVSSSPDYSPQTERRNSSPNRLYSPHRPKGIVPSQPIAHIPHTHLPPHQNHRPILETPITPLSGPAYRGRDKSSSSSSRRSGSYNGPPRLTQSGHPYPYAYSTSPYAVPVAMQPAGIPEPPYVAVNPFSLYPSDPVPPLTLPISTGHRRQSMCRRLRNLSIFLRLPLQIYMHLLLRLPLLYFSRVSRLFEDANLSTLDIRRMVVANAHQWKDGTPGSLMTMWLPEEAALSPNLHNFRHSWEAFIDSLMREWKTQNVVSALMLSAILTVLQIDGAASDPITRTTALLSLISALVSLLFGSMYIMRFGGMRKMYKAASWAEEAQKGSTSMLWNVWILLAMPAIWLIWSILLFVTCIMAFTWRTGAIGEPVQTALSHNIAQGLRIGVSALLAVAFIYFLLVVNTFRKYGDGMDRRWNEKVIEWTQKGRYAQIGMHPGAWVPDALPNHYSRTHPPHSRAGSSDTTPSIPHGSRSSSTIERRRGRSESRRGLSFPPPVDPDRAISFNRPVNLAAGLGMGTFPATKIMDLPSKVYPLPTILQNRDILLEDWARFAADLADIWDGKSKETPPFPLGFEPGPPPATVTRESGAAGLMHLWNTKFFYPRFAEAVLCREEPRVGVPGYSVYLIPKSPDSTSSAPAMPSPNDYDLKGITVLQLGDDPQGRRWSNQKKIPADLPDDAGHREGQTEAEVETLGPSWKTVLPSTAGQNPSTSQRMPSSGSSLYLSIPLPPSPASDAPPAPNAGSPLSARPRDSGA
ncbi:hypothetical protein B0H16DRAFT_1891250 [Mycena metata]|uniref:Uncharacterized protein n=1 Tax=Mycena metata TaxID=1033252 RepID=A0AAD7MZB3_9AGAR|nr:hypothetical protein B0H16DRAFT_1891250 [Mycena metata]